MREKAIGIIWGFLLFLAMGATKNENDTVANVATFFFGGSAVLFGVVCLLVAMKWYDITKKIEKRE